MMLGAPGSPSLPGAPGRPFFYEESGMKYDVQYGVFLCYKVLILSQQYRKG